MGGPVSPLSWSQGMQGYWCSASSRQRGLVHLPASFAVTTPAPFNSAQRGLHGPKSISKPFSIHHGPSGEIALGDETWLEATAPLPSD